MSISSDGRDVDREVLKYVCSEQLEIDLERADQGGHRPPPPRRARVAVNHRLDIRQLTHEDFIGGEWVPTHPVPDEAIGSCVLDYAADADRPTVQAALRRARSLPGQMIEYKARDRHDRLYAATAIAENGHIIINADSVEERQTIPIDTTPRKWAQPKRRRAAAWNPAILVGVFLIGVGMCFASLYMPGYIDTKHRDIAELRATVAALEVRNDCLTTEVVKLKADRAERRAEQVERAERIRDMAIEAERQGESFEAALYLSWIAEAVEGKDLTDEELIHTFAQVMRDVSQDAIAKSRSDAQ